MLTRENRLTSSRLFGHTVRRGRRAGTATVVVHAHAGPRPAVPAPGATAVPGTDAPPRVGFVVSKAVGGAVVRNRVKRRLRHLVRARLGVLPGSTMLVVRALPPAASAPYARLERDFEKAWTRVNR